jgi:hypothetical protein
MIAKSAHRKSTRLEKIETSAALHACSMACHIAAITWLGVIDHAGSRLRENLAIAPTQADDLRGRDQHGAEAPFAAHAAIVQAMAPIVMQIAALLQRCSVDALAGVAGERAACAGWPGAANLFPPVRRSAAPRPCRK